MLFGLSMIVIVLVFVARVFSGADHKATVIVSDDQLPTAVSDDQLPTASKANAGGAQGIVRVVPQVVDPLAPGLHCTIESGNSLITINDDGTTYAINGSARAARRWADGKMHYPPKLMQFFLKNGLRICDAVAGDSDHRSQSDMEIDAPGLTSAEAPLDAKGLIWAADQGDIAYVRRYIAAGKSVNVHLPSADGARYAVDGAAANGHCDLLDVLLDHGAKADPSKQAVGFTPLYLAASGGHAQCVQSLLRRRVRVDVRNVVGGDTPLIAASYAGHYDAAKLLIDAGASLKMSNEDGDTAYRAAISFGNSSIASYIEEHGGI